MTAAGERHRRLALAALLLLAAAIRIASANYGLWFDEIASTAFAREPLHHLWGGWMVRENNPPLFYTLLKAWIAVVGDSDLALRLLPIGIGLGGIALAWRIADRLGGTVPGLLVVALLALSVADIEVSQEVRGYILGYVATLAATYAAIRYLDRRQITALASYAIATLIALHSHTMMAVFAMLVNIAMIALLRRDRLALLRWLAANCFVAIGWAWWIGITLAQVGRVQHSFGWISRPGPAAAAETIAQAYLPGYTIVPVGLPQLLLLAAAVGGILVYVWRDRRPPVLLLACLALGAPILLYAIRQAMPVFTPRTLGWATAPWTILVALAIARIPTRAGMVALVVAILAFEAIVLGRWLPYRAEEDWRAALRIVARDPAHPLVLVQGDAMALAAERYRREIAPAVRIAILPRAAGTTDGWADNMAAQPRITNKAAIGLLRQTGTVYTLRRGDSDPGAALAPLGIERHLTDPPRARQPYVSRWRLRDQRYEPWLTRAHRFARGLRS